ncbi:hypothetical protein B0J18DRAFT_441388 [Chaetomium sp. MPI-SDFR-AT-0129]|nr:hypothetical protein B0J18DRAFT_441388 [Chaetomium sp. MPI-SDFR-AT-0129]
MAEPSLPRGPAIDVWLSGMPDLPQVVEDNPPFLSSESGRSPSPDREESHQPVSLIHRLQHLDKPVLHLPLLGGREGAQQLPEDVRQLECDISGVARYSKGIYPAEIRSEIEALSGCLPPPDFAYRNEGETREEKQKKDDDEGPQSFGWLRLSRLLFMDRPEASLRTRYALAELDKIRDLGRIARECRRLERCEAAWNAELHGPLLKLALSRQGRSGSVTYENATSARILPCFRPTFVTGDLWGLSGREEVDYVIAPRLSPEVDAAIEERLLKAYMLAEPTAGAQAQDQLHVNQTGYPPLARSPMAISIAVTVGSADTEMARLQLGIWTAAWH